MKRINISSFFSRCLAQFLIIGFSILPFPYAHASFVPYQPLVAIPSSQVGEKVVQVSAVDRILEMVDMPSGTTKLPPVSVPTSSTLGLSGLAGGATAIAGIAYYKYTGRDPNVVLANAVASGLDYVFTPAWQAVKAKFVSPASFPNSTEQYIGIPGAIGASLDNLINYAKTAPGGVCDFFKTLVNNNTTAPSTDFSNIRNDLSSIFTYNGINYIAANNNPWLYGGSTGYDAWTTGGYFLLNSSGSVKTYGILQSGGCITVDQVNTTNWTFYRKEFVPTSSPSNLPINPGQTDYAAIENGIPQWQLDHAAEFNRMLQNMPASQVAVSSNPAPTSVPAPGQAAISQNQLQNFFTQNTSNVYNQYLDSVTNNVNSTSNEINQAAAETAKAEEEAKKEPEETFNPISDSAFVEPYNPGEFDIPARFSSFVNTVKSSPLFSFSNSFFESIPGGGSPVYEIEAGQYGHHTIDLSQSMSVGLAVLKTILLACFGFLSIRAVIMKR